MINCCNHFLCDIYVTTRIGHAFPHDERTPYDESLRIRGGFHMKRDGSFVVRTPFWTEAATEQLSVNLFFHHKAGIMTQIRMIRLHSVLSRLLKMLVLLVVQLRHGYLC